MTPRSPAPEDEQVALLIEAAEYLEGAATVAANRSGPMHDPENKRQWTLAQAVRAAALLRPALSARVNDGYVLVPVEPTEAMIIDGAAAVRDFFSEAGPFPRTKAMWRAMISAAPQSQSISKEFDWSIVHDAVMDAVSNGEGHITERYLKLAFEHHGLIVTEKPK